MNIIEAYEANKTQKVKAPGGNVYEVGAMSLVTTWRRGNIFGEWSVVREPKEVWVNEYENDRCVGHPSKRYALMEAGSHAIRKAVLYREVIDG